MSKTTSQKTVDIAEMTAEQLKAEIDQAEARQQEIEDKIDEIEASLRPLRHEQQDVYRSVEKMRRQLAEASLPFKKGDIVEDDQGVRYRVHEVFRQQQWSNRSNRVVEAGAVHGIRLTKNGMEAYSRPREIVSSKPLVKVQV